MNKLLVSAMGLTLLSFFLKDKLTGRWVSPPSVNGNVTTVVFKEDGRFDGFINQKPFVTGVYTLKDSVFAFTDNGCEGKEGRYKTVFFCHDDSLRFQAISDDCTERKAGMERIVLGRAR